MRGFPPELLYVLFFIGLLMFQFLMKRRAGRGQQEPTPDGGDDAPAAYEVSQDLGELMRSLPLIRSPALSAAPADTRRRPEPAAPVRARTPHRFARESLFSNRRDVQNAVVIATILGPCRALEPPGDAAAATPPQRAAPR